MAGVQDEKPDHSRLVPSRDGAPDLSKGNKRVAPDIIKPILLIVGLAALLLYSPLIIGALLDAFGGEPPRIIVRILVLLLIGIVMTVGISQYRRRKAGRSGSRS